MELREVGKSGIKVSPICAGTWAAGGGWEWGKALPDEVYIEALRGYFDAGINFVDTACYYGFGHSQEMVGKAIKKYPREKIIISDKQFSNGLTKEKCRETVETCLKRLDTDYIDFFVVHWPSPDVEVGEVMESLAALKEEGLIRSIGASNYTVAHLERARKYAQVDIIQPCFSLYWRQIEKDLLPYCRENNIGIMTYSSMGQGILTGKYNRGATFDEGDQRPKSIPLYQPGVFEKGNEMCKKIEEVGAKYGKTCAQTAINWVYNTPGITSAIVGVKTREQAEENVGALDWKLSDEDYRLVGDYGREVADLVADWETLFAKKHRGLTLGEDTYRK